MTLSRWAGQLEFGDGWARWRGVPGDASLHAHSAAQAVLGLCAIEDAHGDTIAADAMLIEPMAPHRIVGGGAVEIVFVEPWAHATGLPVDVAQALAMRVADAHVLAGPGSRSYWAGWRHAPIAPTKPSPDAWSIEARRFIDERLGDGRVALDDLARHAQLSAEHARHRFAAAIGLPFKRYVLWRRLRLASLALQRGLDATAAAHESGFADSAHLARTLKTMFGVTITQALRTP